MIPLCIRHWFLQRKRRFAAWFREWAKSLIIEDDSSDLEVILPGRGTVRVTVVAIAGMMLHVRLPDGSERLIGVRDARVEDRYWRLWKRLGGAEFTWADGTKFDPTGESP